MSNLAFLRPENNVLDGRTREDLLTNFSKTEKIATEVEFILPRRTTRIKKECRNYQNTDGGYMCAHAGTKAPCDDGGCPFVDRGEYTTVLNSLFEPSRSDVNHGKRGYGAVKTEGSIPNGLELTTVGRRIVYGDLLQQNEFTTSQLLKLGCSVNPRCGLHYHYLLGYYPSGGPKFKEMQMDIPVSVLANVYQLHLLNADVLFWLSAAGESTEYATRYMKFRQTPLSSGGLEPKANVRNNSMRGVITRLSEMSARQKYGFINMVPTVFKDRETIDIFHLEVRYPDAVLSYQYLTMFQILTAAIIKKAVTLAEFGILVPDEDEDLVYGAIGTRLQQFCGQVTHRGDDIDDRDFLGLKRRTKNMLTDDAEKIIQQKAKEFVDFLKPELCSYAPTVYTQLHRLCDAPVFKIRNDGGSWKDVDDYLFVNKIDEETQAIIDGLHAISSIQIVTGKKSLNAWISEVSGILDIKPSILLDAATKTDLEWDEELGACIRNYK